MSVTATLLEILKYTIPAIVVLIAASTIVKRFLNAENRRRQLALFEGSQDITLRLRLQAYERLAMLLERISSRQLVPRVYDSAMTVGEFQYALTLTIRTEFEHNLSQQVYVSKNVWETVKGVKEQELNMINRVGQSLDPDLPARELYARILEMIARTDAELPTDVGLQIVHAEAKTVLQYGSY